MYGSNEEGLVRLTNKKGGEAMGKMIRLVAISLLILSTIWMGCYSTKAKPTTIDNYNISLLKGKWEGLSTFGNVANSIRVPTTMEIYNDAVPLKGKLIIHNVPPSVLSKIAAKPGASSGDATIEFRDGNINEQGHLVGKQGENYFEAALWIPPVGQKLKMDGWIYYSSLNSSMTLNR